MKTLLRKRLLILSTGLLLLSACHTTKKASSVKLEAFKYNYCAPTVPYLKTSAIFTDPQPIRETVKTATNISEHDVLLCQILGINSYINALWELKQDRSSDRTAQYLLLKQKINSRMSLAQSELDAVAAELDCEGERSDMAATYLDGLNSKRNRNLTVASVTLGALTTVATALIKNDGVQTGVGVSGGLVSAGLGALTINPKGKKVEFYHERNLLKPIWNEEVDNTDYPDFVWKILHEKKFSNKGDLSLAQSIKNRWITFEFDGKIEKEQKKLLFGTGGYYRSDDLHTRSAMINQLQSTIRSIHQDFTSLIRYIDQL